MQASSDQYDWTDFTPRDDGPERAGDVVLRDSGWNALVAFLAGPRHVKAVASRPPAAVTVTRISRDQRSGERAARSWQQALTDADGRSVHADMCEYLALTGLPSPPAGTHWVLELPRHVDPVAFWAALHEAAAPAQDEVARHSVAGREPPPKVWSELREGVSRELRRLLEGDSQG